MATVTVECRTCGNEQDLVVELTHHYTDADLRAQLEAVSACEHCGDQDWSPQTVED